MHTLHRILVKVSDPLSPRWESEGLEDEEIEDAVRNYAEIATENENIYDYRETETAGGYSCEYPNNVILSKNGVERFKRELESIASKQNEDIQFYLKKLKNYSYDIRELVKLSEKTDQSYEEHLALWRLKELTDRISGVYTIDSPIYDSYRNTAKITKETLKEVDEDPDNWALVMFDYHS